ncbi:substrate-binding domain-containing protein [Protaetiibacter sp. WY-16]|uniref:Substrate-binding domain-containing protein n=2 Tax=Antiquaquibacter soli TaxID=3064523 RepID=A0ABT9BNT8_9MICO|nr:substrate-binding domain-containing protein [Protaetiibacter sp. WY-16]
MDLKDERLREIAKLIRSRGRVETVALATEMGVSLATIRRDLADLEQRGTIRRVHGGAMLSSRTQQAPQRSDATGEPLTIGMVLPRSGYYYGPVIRGANRAARELGARLLVSIADDSLERELALVQRMIDNGVDGLMISTSGVDYPDGEFRDLILSLPIPVVMLERDPELLFGKGVRLDSVVTSHGDGVQDAVRYLHSSGRSRIALLSPGFYATPEMRRGYLAATEELGLPQLPFLVSKHWSPARTRLPWEVVQELLDDGCDAILIHPEQDAVDALQDCLARGMSIPDDLAIVSYDDELSAFCEVPLTAVAPPKTQVGFQAVQRCVELCTADDDRAAPQRIAVYPELRIRKSTGVAETA